MTENLEIIGFDAVEYFAVQHRRRLDARARAWREQVDPAARECVDAPGDLMLLGQRAPHPRIDPAVSAAPEQQLTIHPVGGQFVGG